MLWVINNVLNLYHLAYFNIKTLSLPQCMQGRTLLSLPFQWHPDNLHSDTNTKRHIELYLRLHTLVQLNFTQCLLDF